MSDKFTFYFEVSCAEGSCDCNMLLIEKQFIVSILMNSY